MTNKQMTIEEKANVFDVIAKAMLVRIGGTTTFTKQELEDACQFKAKLNMNEITGLCTFSIEAN